MKWFVLSLGLVTLSARALAQAPEETPAPAEAPLPEPAPPTPMPEAVEVAPPVAPALPATRPAAPEPPLASPLPPPAEDYGARAQTNRPVGPGEFDEHGTGSRLNVPLRELPATVSLVNRRELAERGVVDLNQALGLMSGVMPTFQYGGFQHIRVRGFQAMTLVDGRRDPRALLADSAPQVGIYDLERIELLRGPASVLYGYGATGGVVNMIRRRPSNRRQAELDVGLGLPNQKRAHAGAQGAIGPMLSYRVDMGHVSHENFRGAVTKRNQATSTLRFAPNRHHTVNLRISYANDRYSTDVGIPTVEELDRPGTWILPPDTRRSNWYGTKNDYLAYQRLEIAADYRADLTKHVYLEARAALTKDRYEYLAAETLTYVPESDTAPASVDREYLYFVRGWKPLLGQLELHGDTKTGPIDHQLVVGYQLDRFGGTSQRGNVGDAVPGSVEFVYPVDRAVKVSTLQRTAKDHYRQIVHALYAFDHMKVGQNVIVTGGARLDAVKNRTRREFVDRYSDDEIPDPNTGMVRSPNRQTQRAVTGQAGVVLTPLEFLTGYLGYATSFMPQIVYPSATSVTKYEPERGQQIEGGLRLRSKYLGHELGMDAAAYFIQKKNIVIPRGPDDFVQAGKVHSRGMDLAAHYRAPYLVEFTAGYSLTVASYERFVSADPVSGDNLSRKGNEVDFAPRHSGTAWLRLSPIAGAGIGCGTRMMGRQYADPENRLPLPSHALFDASLWFGGEHATFTLSANNLFNEHDYVTSVINTWAQNPQVTPGPGREILGVLSLVL